MDWDSVCYFLIFLYLIVVWLDEKCPLDPEAKAALEVEKALPMSENNIEVEEEYSDTDSVVESVASRGSRYSLRNTPQRQARRRNFSMDSPELSAVEEVDSIDGDNDSIVFPNIKEAALNHDELETRSDISEVPLVNSVQEVVAPEVSVQDRVKQLELDMRIENAWANLVHYSEYKDVFWHGFRRLKRYRNLVDGIALLCLIIIVGFYMGPGSIDGDNKPRIPRALADFGNRYTSFTDFFNDPWNPDHYYPVNTWFGWENPDDTDYKMIEFEKRVRELVHDKSPFPLKSFEMIRQQAEEEIEAEFVNYDSSDKFKDIRLTQMPDLPSPPPIVN